MNFCPCPYGRAGETAAGPSCAVRPPLASPNQASPSPERTADLGQDVSLMSRLGFLPIWFLLLHLRAKDWGQLAKNQPTLQVARVSIR